MIRKNPYEGKKKLWKKVLCLIVCMLFFVAALVVSHMEIGQKKPGADDTGRIESATEQTTESTQEAETETTQEERKDEAQNPENEKPDEQTEAVPITNLSYYVTPIMGEDAHMFESALGKWVAAYEISCSDAEILNVMVPDEEPDAVRYYLLCHDEADTILLLEYHSFENVVTISGSNYSYADITGEVWNGDAPNNRDVSAAEELEYYSEQLGMSQEEIMERIEEGME